MHNFWKGLQGLRASGYRFLYPFRPLSAFWVEIFKRRNLGSLPFSVNFRCLGRDLPTGGNWNLYPFRLFFAVWVEIHNRQLLESLPFSPVFRCLGRNFQPAAPGFSTFSPIFRCLGRDSQPAALGT